MATLDDRFEVSMSLTVRTASDKKDYFSAEVAYASMDYPHVVGVEAEMLAMLQRLAALGEAQAATLTQERK
jgi:preprotein translocase subunit SecB